MKDIVLIKDFHPIDLTSLEIASRLSNFYKVFIYINPSSPTYKEDAAIINLGLADFNLIGKVEIISNLDFNNKDCIFIQLDKKLGKFDKSIECKYNSSIFSLDDNSLQVDLPYIESEDILKGRNFYTSISILNYFVKYKRYFAKKVLSYLSISRYNHIVNVANLAYLIAKSNSLDPYLAFKGGYYHDLTRNSSLFTKYNDIVDLKYAKYFYNNEIPCFMYHQFTCEYALKDIFKIEDENLFEMIRFHTSANKDMSKLAKVVFAADKIEPGRDYESYYLVNECLLDIDNGFKQVLKANKEYLEGQANYDPKKENLLTISCYECYLNKGEK